MDKDGVIGLGLKSARKPTSLVEDKMPPVDYVINDTGKRLFGSLNKPRTYLSQFILHIAAIGDIVDGTDTTHDFNFFSVIYEWPKDVRTFSSFDLNLNSDKVLISFLYISSLDNKPSEAISRGLQTG